MSILNIIGSYPTGGLGQSSASLGQTLYVHSTLGKDGNPGTISAPLASVFSSSTGALARLNTDSSSQNRGDNIICLPGHSEDIPSSTAAAVSRANVTIQGLGYGASRPTFTVSTATGSTVTISAANVTFDNLVFSVTFAAVVAVFTVGAKDFRFVNSEINESGSGTIVSFMVTSATTSNLVDGLTILNSRLVALSTINDIGVSFTGTNDRVNISNNEISMKINASIALINCLTGKNLTNCTIKNNALTRLSTATAPTAINLVGTANTGMIAYNQIKCAIAAIANLVSVIDATGCGLIENYATGEDDKSGILVPAADAT